MTSSTGIVASVDIAVYQNSAGTQNLTRARVYVQNTGNVNMTLQLDAANWYPSATAEYITVNWDFTPGDLITPRTITPIQIRLSVSVDIQNIQTFDFDILLTSSSIP